MAVRGSIAKQNIINKLQQSFGDNFIGEKADKRIYVLADDGGTKVQIAISLACPKTQINEEISDTLSTREMNDIASLLERCNL